VSNEIHNIDTLKKESEYREISNKDYEGYKNEISNIESAFYKKEEVSIKEDEYSKEEKHLLPINVKREVQDDKTNINIEKNDKVFAESNNYKSKEEDNKTQNVKEIHIESNSTIKGKKLKFF
jgi:hypothetical protein